MEFMFDTVNISAIERYGKSIPICGVTSNPTIIKAEGKIDFYNHFQTIKSIIKTGSLHIQLISGETDMMLQEAAFILDKLGKDIFIKIPVTEQGLTAIRKLKSKGINITATAIYTKMQGFLAIKAGADYIAPYFNRMQNMDTDPVAVISSFREIIDSYDYKTKILAASFKNTGQINIALECGAHSITAAPEVIAETFKLAQVNKAVDDFTKDWENLYGKGSTTMNIV